MADTLPENTRKFGFCHFLADILPENTRKFGFCHFFGRCFAPGRLSAFSWQIFGTYLERKKELADFCNLVFVFLLNFETNFGGKLDENQPKKVPKSREIGIWIYV